MSDKREISGRETYVIDEDTLEQLDDVSLTGIVRGLDRTNTMKRLRPNLEEPDELEDIDKDGH